MLTSLFDQQQLRIKQLDLSGLFNSLPYDETSALFDSLQRNRTLEYLCLGGSLVWQKTSKREQRFLGQSIRQFLQHNKTLQSLNLGNNGLGRLINHEVAVGLQSNQTLKEFVYGGNWVSDDNAAALAEAFCQNPQITKLSLGCNEIGNNGLLALSHYLRCQSSLIRLLIPRHGGNAQGIQVLTNALSYNLSLQELDICTNSHYTVLDQIQCLEFLKYNSTIQWVDISSERVLSPQEETVLRQAYKKILDYNDTVEEIWFATNPMQALRWNNDNGIRIAPKKGGLQRWDIFHWLTGKGFNLQSFSPIRYN
jgi:hypothetical protein